jgi:hypothetical protein
MKRNYVNEMKTRNAWTMWEGSCSISHPILLPSLPQLLPPILLSAMYIIYPSILAGSDVFNKKEKGIFVQVENQKSVSTKAFIAPVD